MSEESRTQAVGTTEGAGRSGASGAGVRTVIVRGPGRELETLLVARGIALLLAATVLVGSLRSAPEPAEEIELPPAYEVGHEDLTEMERNLAGELRTALEDVVYFQAELGEWPDPEVLSDNLIPPFASTFAGGAEIVYAWRLESRPGGGAVYLGLPPVDDDGDGGAGEVPVGLPALHLSIQPTTDDADPLHPAIDVGFEKGHGRLPEGTLYHYAVWLRTPAPGTDDVPVDPAAEGWRKVVVAAR